MIPVVAHTGAAALEKIRTEAPDLLIVDWKLPDMDGMQTMQAAKALDEDLPIIVATLPQYSGGGRCHTGWGPRLPGETPQAP
jgi:DNA-binding response OmpR family regulator